MKTIAVMMLTSGTGANALSKNLLPDSLSSWFGRKASSTHRVSLADKNMPVNVEKFEISDNTTSAPAVSKDLAESAPQQNSGRWSKLMSSFKHQSQEKIAADTQAKKPAHTQAHFDVDVEAMQSNKNDIWYKLTLTPIYARDQAKEQYKALPSVLQRKMKDSPKSFVLHTRYSFLDEWTKKVPAPIVVTDNGCLGYFKRVFTSKTANLQTKAGFAKWLQYMDEQGFYEFTDKPKFSEFPAKTFLFAKQAKTEERVLCFQTLLSHVMRDVKAVESFVAFHEDKVQEVVFDNKSYMLAGKKQVRKWNSFKNTVADNIKGEYLEMTFWENGQEPSVDTLNSIFDQLRGNVWLDPTNLDGKYCQAYAKQFVLKEISKKLQSPSVDVQELMETSFTGLCFSGKTYDHFACEYYAASAFETTLKIRVHDEIAMFLYEHGEQFSAPKQMSEEEAKRVVAAANEFLHL